MRLDDAARAALCSLTLVFACASATPPHRYAGPPPANAHDRALARFAERFLDVTLRHDPVRASALGYHRYDDRLPDLSEAGVSATVAALEGLRRELGRIDPKKLSTPYRVDHALMADELDRRRFELEVLAPQTWDVQLYNEQVGAGLYHLTIPPADPADAPARLDAIIGRLEALPKLLETARARLTEPPKALTEFVVDNNPGNLRTIRETLPPLFEGHPERAARFEAVRPAAEAALEAYQTFLERDLLPRSTGDWRLGPQRFARKLAHTLGTQLSPKAIYERAERGLRRARFQMYDVAIGIFRERFPDDRRHLELLGDARIDYVVGKVIEEASKDHGTADSMISDVTARAEVIQGWLRDNDFVDLPPKTDAFVIEPTPAFLDGLAAAFYNPAPAFEPELKKSFWISSVPTEDPAQTESFLREYNRYTLDALTIHEAFPGHYVQQYWSSHAEDASIVKRVLESGTMAEGWAMMIAQLMHEAGWERDDPRQLLFHLEMQLRIYVNAMIDVRLHTSITEDPDALDAWALELMTKRGFQEAAEASRKLRRAKLTSTQLSTYFVGYREMLDLYRALEAKGSITGKAARMKLVSYGTIPPRLIRELLEEEGLL